jgi:hypothetical protein
MTLYVETPPALLTEDSYEIVFETYIAPPPPPPVVVLLYTQSGAQLHTELLELISI